MKKFRHIPQKIATTFNALREKSTDRLVLRVLNDRYYVYKDKGIWLKDKKTSKTLSEYLGRITEDGSYITKELIARSDIGSAIKLIKSRGYEVTKLGEESIAAKRNKLNVAVDDIDLKLLMILSMNARIPMPRLAKLAGVKPSAAYRRVKALEKKVGIKYILEVNLLKLGYTPYVLFIKFEKTKPSIEELKTIVNKQPRIQFAAATKGDYDLIVYFIEADPINTFDYIYTLLTQTELKKYESIWSYEPFAEVYSFMPLKKEFFEQILATRQWQRSKETPKPSGRDLLRREQIVLSELNDNSAESFSEVDNKYGFARGTARYTYNTMVQKGIIKRATITMQNLPLTYVGILQEVIVNGEETDKFRYRPLFDIIEYGDIANKYALVANMGNPFGSLFLLPVTYGGELDKAAHYLESETKGVTIKTSIISDIITGALCYRRFDKYLTRQYGLLVDRKEVEATIPVNYG